MFKYIVLMILCCAYVIQRGICQLKVECGIVAPEGETLIINGGTVKAAEFPWHVGLYGKSSKGMQQICGGTIVNPILVVTAAHCVFKDGVGLYEASEFAVAAGKIYRRWKASRDDEQYVQKIEVDEINIPDEYRGAINSFTADIAILVLKKNFTFNSFVRPICIKFDNQDNLNGQYGRVAGWGLTEEGGRPSSILQTVRLPIISFEDCYNNSPEGFRPLIVYDKICAGYTNGTALCKGDSGGGLVFSRKTGTKELYYLYGIVSTSPRNEAMTSCSAYSYTAFTNLKKHQKWFQDISLIKFRRGQCEPLKSISVDFKCYKHDSTSATRSILETSCDQPQDNYSHAKAKCKDSYYLEPQPKDLLCVDGSWDYVPHCTPECGIVAPQANLLVIGGETGKIGELPWHVGIYYKIRNMQHICSGTIVSSNLVITAAFCLYSDAVGSYQASNYAVAAGKIYRDWNAPDAEDEKYAQKINVSKIEIHPQYRGVTNAYESNLAVLILEKSFVFSSLIMPACIQFDSKDNLTGQLGKVAGWGLTEEGGLPSPILQTVSLPVVSSENCYNNTHEFFRRLITPDKICAGYTNGTALCDGDSGGGLVFSRRDFFQDVYYLYGIVSISPRNDEETSCSAFAYTTFTNLINHQEWFQEILSTYNIV